MKEQVHEQTLRPVPFRDAIMMRMIPFMLFTDIAFFVYWAISGVMLTGIELVPVEYLYNDYHNPLMYAWNWSFFPLDMVLAVTGVYSVRLYRRSDARWFPMALFSISLTFCAGFMAVSFWAITRDFDLSWWIPNLFFAIWPLYFLRRFLIVETESE